MANGKSTRRSRMSLSAPGTQSALREHVNGGDTTEEPVFIDSENEEREKQEEQEEAEGEEEEHAGEDQRPQKKAKVVKSSGSSSKKKKQKGAVAESFLIGDPFPATEAVKRWPARYSKKNGKKGGGSVTEKQKSDDGEEILLDVKCHYKQAEVDGVIYELSDCAYVKGEAEGADYIGRIIEFFETTDGQQYFTAQWFFKSEDTVIKEDRYDLHDKRRVFHSEIRDDNLLECIISKLKIVQVAPNVDLEAKEKSIPSCDYYYDMSYSLQYSTFSNLRTESPNTSSNTSSTISSEAVAIGVTTETKSDNEDSFSGREFQKSELSLLDLYSGCGGMSTGLCHGGNLAGVNLVTRWAIDLNEHACESLKLNHPETEVRNEMADDFLDLLKEWPKLCKRFSLLGTERSLIAKARAEQEDDEEEDNSKVPPGEFEVSKLLGICYGDPNKLGKRGLHFKVRWKGYGAADDTWEPIDGLSKCQEAIRDFVTNGYKSHILPFQGDVDVICGGPPCQGISGFNRFRNKEKPLDDEKNHQMVVYMDMVEYLKPKYVLMENVVDILKFAGGHVGRYALSRLVHMNYQARLGMMAAGCYGLPQFRMRVFLWGARPTEKLPQYPLPTHDVVVRGGVPNEFERNVVAYDEHQHRKLEKKLLLEDAISDLPAVTNYESRDEIPYGKAPRTEFQRYIRSIKQDTYGCSAANKKPPQKGALYDHQPLKLNDDDYLRACRIPKRKGANFRDLPGVAVGADNVVEWDPSVERVYLPSGKPLVPDYAMTFVKGRSTKPFGRLWWDETVPTVVTRAEPHNQAILHPEQDRVLTIRENARLQGFPDYYKLCGPVKERYIQVGNAVAVPVARALGYALGMAHQGIIGEGPLMNLPQKFPHSLQRASSTSVEEHS